nr:MAG TPA: hypothetical protein [Bacteriophage sp.]
MFAGGADLTECHVSGIGIFQFFKNLTKNTPNF